jgi:acyl homoserine lactone synthase
VMYLIDRDCFGAFAHELAEMHRLRYRVFKERLDWDVTVSGDMEIDDYDALDPVYYVVHCNPAGGVQGCVRFLPTTGPNMLSRTFPALLGPEAAPRSRSIWEISRFSLDIEAPSQKMRRGLSPATFELLAGVFEFGMTRGLSYFSAVTDLLFERIMRRAGVPWRRIHDPRRVGRSLAVAGYVDVSAAVLDHLCVQGGLRRPVLTTPFALKETA